MIEYLPVRFRRLSFRHILAFWFVTLGLTWSIPTLAEESTSDRKVLDPSGSIPVNDQGVALRAFLDGMAVDRYWLRSNERILWSTGEPKEVQNGRILPPLSKDETHCSAFVAAAAQRLGVYILRPPDHSHILLANAQYEWLAGPQGRAAGWQPVTDAVQTQRLANEGKFVVAVVRSHNPKLAGHIAVVAPCVKSEAQVKQLGPQICQAGFDNFPSAPLARGFERHPGAWSSDGTGSVRFYFHQLDKSDVGRIGYVDP